MAGFQLKNPNVGVRCDNVDSKHSFNGTVQIFKLGTNLIDNMTIKFRRMGQFPIFLQQKIILAFD
jgi:hypothetical protein